MKHHMTVYEWTCSSGGGGAAVDSMRTPGQWSWNRFSASCSSSGFLSASCGGVPAAVSAAAPVTELLACKTMHAGNTSQHSSNAAHKLSTLQHS
jgi:hypothetical protein